jgi:hypothetical protein
MIVYYTGTVKNAVSSLECFFCGFTYPQTTSYDGKKTWVNNTTPLHEAFQEIDTEEKERKNRLLFQFNALHKNNHAFELFN